MEIRGSRVILRDPRPSDHRDMRRWMEPSSDWQHWDAPWEWNEESRRRRCESWVRRLGEAPADPRTSLQIDTMQGRHIGWLGTYWIDEANRWKDCGIVIAEEDCLGRGLGREAFTLWVDYLVEAHDLPRIGMGTWSGNERMIRLAARVGMHEEAHFAGARKVGETRYGAVRWGMTRAQWEHHRAPRSDGLRRYARDDWHEAVELVRQLYQHHRELQRAPTFTDRDARETVFGWLARRDTTLWIHQEAGQIVGLVRARREGVCFLEELVVREGHRRRGVGRRMLSAIEAELRDAGDQDVFLSTLWPGNLAAVDFYRRCGYNVINTIELRKGLREDRGGRSVRFLKRGFRLGKSVPDDRSPGT